MRVGDWRILLFIDEQEEVVEVTAIGPRGQVYREL
jgi:mRNA-degrading endonuclease RelE of RelBE toxin-antitoxin system